MLCMIGKREVTQKASASTNASRTANAVSQHAQLCVYWLLRSAAHMVWRVCGWVRWRRCVSRAGGRVGLSTTPLPWALRSPTCQAPNSSYKVTANSATHPQPPVGGEIIINTGSSAPSRAASPSLEAPGAVPDQARHSDARCPSHSGMVHSCHRHSA